MINLDKYEAYRDDLNFMRQYSSALNSATGSAFDPNANVVNKNIATMAPEIHKKANIFANRLAMHDKITELYGKELADEYIRQLESHEIYRNDESGMPVGTPYCVSCTLYPFLRRGLKDLGGTSEKPKTLDSFCGGFINLVFLIAAQFAGAVATPEFLPYLTYFLVNEYGEDFYLRENEIVDNGKFKKTIGDVINAKFKQIVYSLNQPAAARGSQSVFWNIAYFDKPYFMGLFENFTFPDGTILTNLWEQVNWLQKKFMVWFNKERTKKILTFPVESFSLLNDGEKYVDKESADWVARMYSEGHSFFTYTSDSVDSLASCCFSEDTEVLWKTSYDGIHRTSLKELHETRWEPYKKNLRIFHNGFWVEGKTIRLPNRRMYQVTTANNKTFLMTDNHINLTLDGEKETSVLTTKDYLAFNTHALAAIPEQDEHLTYEMGFVVGAFLGDGSFGTRIKETIREINFSLNSIKYPILIDNLKKACKQLSLSCEPTLSKIYNNVYPVRISSKELVAFIQRWTNWKEGTYAYNKKLNLNCLSQSIDFRRGILEGWYTTDGGNSNRCYTTSEELAKDMETLITSLGMNSIINISDRTDEACIIRDELFSHNYPVYCVRWYSPTNRKNMKDIYQWKNNTIYFKITNIEEINSYNKEVYCIERKDNTDPYFTLPNGFITHNCRLRNELQENTFSYTLGAGGISTGSKCVMTMNINRLVQNAARDGADISERVAEQTHKIHKYLIAFNEILKELKKNKMLQVYDAGFISLEKQYLTTGINGFVEGAEFLGIEISDNKQYREYAEKILRPIYEIDKQDRTEELMFNCEFIPAENLGVKNAKWDKADGYVVPRDCYNSYFYKVEDSTLSPMDKFQLHGKNYTKYCDGGSAVHCNLKEHLSKDQYSFILNYAIKAGTPYFTFNIPNTICNDCGHITKHYLDKCPKCKSENIDYASRIIGYLVRISKWSADRQAEHSRRYYG